MRKPFVAGNWKMNKTVEQAAVLVEELLSGLNAVPEVEKVLCPPFTSLMFLSAQLQDSDTGLGAQDLHWEASGAFTGAVAPPWCANSANMSLSVIPNGAPILVRPMKP